MLYINMVYTIHIIWCVSVICVLIEKLVPARPPKKFKGLILHLKDPILPKWFLEAALQLKISWMYLIFIGTSYGIRSKPKLPILNNIVLYVNSLIIQIWKRRLYVHNSICCL